MNGSPSGPTDPTDWSFAPLKELDALLRCAICFEYFRTAMILSSCSHTYCSLCIRKFLLVRPQCPTCSAPAKESQLVNNRPLDELVEVFVKSRAEFARVVEPQGMACNGETPPPPPPPPALVRRSELLTPKSSVSGRKRAAARVPRPAAEGPSAAVAPPPGAGARVPLPPLHIPVSLLDEGSVGTGEGNRYPLPPAAPRNQLPPTAPGMTSPVVISDDGEEEVMVTEYQNCTTPSSSGSMVAATALLRVQCPICGLALSERLINLHLDQCLQKSQGSSSDPCLIEQIRPKKLPKIVWNLLKDKDLKKKLKEYHLPAIGRRHDMILRLQEFSLRYNAQCDSLNPKTIEQIADDMAKDELARQNVSGSPSSNVHVPKGSTDEEIEHLRKQYESQHKDQFTQLTRELCQRSKQSSSPPPPSTVTIVPSSPLTTSLSPAAVTVAVQPFSSEGAEPTVSPEAWQKRLRLGKSREPSASLLLHTPLDNATSSDDNGPHGSDGDDEDFVELRRASKRWKQ